MMNPYHQERNGKRLAGYLGDIGPGQRRQEESTTEGMQKRLAEHGYRGTAPVKKQLEDKFELEEKVKLRDFLNLKSTLESTNLKTKPNHLPDDTLYDLNETFDTATADSSDIAPGSSETFTITPAQGFDFMIYRIEPEVYGQLADEELRIDVRREGRVLYGLRDRRVNSFSPNKSKNVEIHVPQETQFQIHVRNPSGSIASHDIKINLVGKRLASGNKFT